MDKLDYAGIDVSSKTLEVAISRDGRIEKRSFSNDSSGHLSLKFYLEKKKDRRVRVVFESTGVYGLDMAIKLSESETVEISEANPRAVHKFAGASMKRGKNDKMDALVLLEYARRMEFRPFTPPSGNALSLRCIARRMRALSEMKVMEKNRLHAACRTKTTPWAIMHSLENMIEQISQAMEDLKDEAMKIVESDKELKRKFKLITSVKGIAVISGIQILGEIECLPGDLDVRQLVAMAGLDPVEVKSGTSVNAKRGISKQGNKYLRTALHMPALVAIVHDPHVRAYFLHLEDAGKQKSVAITAVTRKLLHSIWGMIENNQVFDGSKFFKPPVPVNVS